MSQAKHKLEIRKHKSDFRISGFLLSALVCLLSAFTPARADEITASIVWTNRTTISNQITVKAITLRYTNDVSSAPSTLLATNNATGSASNFYSHAGTYSLGNVTVVQVATNRVDIIGDSTLTVSLTGTNFATLTLYTNVSDTKFSFWGPVDAFSPANRTNQASQIFYSAKYSSNAVPDDVVAFANYLSLKTLQTFGNKVMTNSTIVDSTLTNSVATNMQRINVAVFVGTNCFFLSGVVSNCTLTNVLGLNGFLDGLTNGALFNTKLTNVTGELRNFFGSNAVIHSLTVTNFRSPGTGSSSFQVGAAASASGDFSVAVGDTSQASGDYAIAIGPFSQALEDFSLAMGDEAVVNLGATEGVALGAHVTANGAYSGVLGNSSEADHDYSWAFGYFAITTAAHQFRMGTASDYVSVPGRLEVEESITNAIFSGTNVFKLAVSYSRTNITTLANGVNLVNPGLKKYIKISGPTANYSIDKITGGWDGREIIFQKTDSYTLTIVNESGSGGGAATDRALTGTGSSITVTQNPGFVGFIYDIDAGRWGVSSKSN